MKHHYGWNAQRPDQRDLKFSVITPSKLPPAVDLRPQMPAVYDQEQLGSCTANAIAAAVDVERKRQGLTFMYPSRLFIYWNERDLEGTTASDSGATIRDGFKAINSQGVCPEAVWRYSNPFDETPSCLAYESAEHHKCLKYLAVAQQTADMLDCLAQGYPFVFGITAYESLESDAVAKTGNVPMPAPSESQIGGHALLAVGYKPGVIRFRNSWSDSWGDMGYGTIPLAYLTNPDLASDFWTIRLEEA